MSVHPPRCSPPRTSSMPGSGPRGTSASPPRLEGLSDRMSALAELCRGVFVLRRVAAADVPATQTLPQMYPRISHTQAFFAALRRRLDVSYLPKNACTPAHLGFYRSRLDSGLSPRTVQYLHVVLHRALKQALRWGLVTRNAAEAVDPPKVHKKAVTHSSPEQARAFLEAASEAGIVWKPSTSSPYTRGCDRASCWLSGGRTLTSTPACCASGARRPPAAAAP